MLILIAGGGKIGVHLTRTLLAEGHEVSVIERDRRVCQAITDDFETVPVVIGDATNPDLLVFAGIQSADVVVAVAGRDQDNYVICKMAKQLFGVKHALARVNDPRNEELFRISGVDSLISVTSMVTHAIDYAIVPHDLVTLFTWHGKMAVVQLQLTDRSPVIGMPLRKLDFPEGSILAVIWRNGEPIIPYGETTLQSGDEVFAITIVGREDTLKSALLG